jgi:hypothetical protein
VSHDLSRTNVLLVVFMMDGCGACEDYTPKFMQRVEAFRAQGVPLRVMGVGSKPLKAGEIPVMLYDAAAPDDELQAFADRLGVTATPTTCLLTRSGTTKVEGAIEPADIDKLLLAAHRANH